METNYVEQLQLTLKTLADKIRENSDYDIYKLYLTQPPEDGFSITFIDGVEGVMERSFSLGESEGKSQGQEDVVSKLNNAFLNSSDNRLKYIRLSKNQNNNDYNYDQLIADILAQMQ